MRIQAHINLNDFVEVTLSERGAVIYTQSQRIPRKPGDTVRHTLWELMEIFGKHLFVGCHPPFVENEIRFKF